MDLLKPIFELKRNSHGEKITGSSELEQLERLRSDDTPRRLMITHTIESYWIPSQKRQSQRYKFKEFAKISHFLKLLDNMCKYEMDQTSIVEDTERTRFCPQTDRRTRWNQYTPASTSLKRGGGGYDNTNEIPHWKHVRYQTHCRL